MGFVDDCLGGYESLALFTNSDGEVDFEAAYDAQIPDEDDYLMDPFDRAIAYKFRNEVGQYHRQNRRRKELVGWRNTGRRTQYGKPIYEGFCTSCHTLCTVPFAPVVGGCSPRCKACLRNKEQDDELQTDIRDFFPREQGRGTRNTHQRGRGRDQHKKPHGQLLPGWTATGNTTYYGKPIYQGHCSNCSKPCTVPFVPVAGGSPPMCKKCLGQPGSRAAAGSTSAAAASHEGVVMPAADDQQQEAPDVY